MSKYKGRLKKTLAVFFAVMMTAPSVHMGFAQTNTAEPIKIGYVESEPYSEFTAELGGMMEELVRLGVLDDSLNLEGISDATEMWQAAARAVNGTALLLPEQCYTLSEMNDKQKAALINNNAVDLYIAMGTEAGKFMMDNNFDENIMVVASADPISAGLTKTVKERLRDNIFAHVDTTRFARQLQAAYNMLHFTSVGVVYEDSDSAYSYSGIEQLEKSAKVYGFEIVTRHVSEPLNEGEREAYYSNLKAAYSEMSDKIDALYITTAAIEPIRLPELLEEVHSKGIPTIAQSTEEQVQYGAFINVSINNAAEEGAFAAYQLKRYLDGVPFKDLEQEFESTPKISINYATAKLLGLKLPVKTLLVVDKIYGGGLDGQ